MTSGIEPGSAVWLKAIRAYDGSDEDVILLCDLLDSARAKIKRNGAARTMADNKQARRAQSQAEVDMIPHTDPPIPEDNMTWKEPPPLMTMAVSLAKAAMGEEQDDQRCSPEAGDGPTYSESSGG